MDDKGRLGIDLTTQEDEVHVYSDDDDVMDWISGGEKPLRDPRHWLNKIGRTYATSENQDFEKQTIELREKNRKLREAHEAKKRKEAGGELVKAKARSAVVGNDSLYATYQPNVTEAHDERESSGARPTTDFTNPTAAAFDLYDQKGGPSSSSSDIKKTKLKRTFDVASLISTRANQQHVIPPPLKAGSLEDKVRKEQQLQLTTSRANNERARDADIATALAKISMDALYERVLDLNLKKVVRLALESKDEVCNSMGSTSKLEVVPNRFMDVEQYKRIFEPLLLEEMTASLCQHIAGGLGEKGGKKKSGQEQNEARCTEIVVVKGAVLRDSIMVELEVALPRTAAGGRDVACTRRT